MLLVVGASAVVDRRDVGPAGIVRAGGEIVHFGMPVDPGNLICLGRIGAIPALVLPGCARSPKLNGIDFVLTRLFAGLPVGRSEVMRMGVGGLLKEIDSRPLPREKAPATPQTGIAPRSAPTIAAVVLAAGPVPPHGAAQQAAGRRPDRQGDDRPRGGQRAVIECAADPGGDRAPVGADPACTGRAAGAVRACGRLRRGIVGQPEGGHCGGARGVFGCAGLPGRHAVGDRPDDRPAAVLVRSGRGAADRAAHVPRQAGQPDAVGPPVLRGDPADQRRFRGAFPDRQAHRGGGRGGDGGRCGAARLRHHRIR